MIRYVLVPSGVPRALEVGVGQNFLLGMVGPRVRTDDHAGRGFLFQRPSPLG
jgi:hypothetical protein